MGFNSEFKGLNWGCWGGCLDRRRTKWQKAGCRSVFSQF